MFKVLAIVFLAMALTPGSRGQTSLKECPDIKPLEPVSVESLLGTWYSMRVGPPSEEYGQDSTWDCVTETLWIDKDTPPNIINTVYHHRINGENEDYKATINTTRTTPKSEYIWDYQITGMSIPTTYMATDGGRSWAIAYSCMESEPGNFTAVWGIASRTRSIDPKLEQTLVKEIEKYAGVGADQLYGIGQQNCF